MADDTKFLLEFESITNLPSPDTHYRHHAEIHWTGDDQLTTTWYGADKGKVLDETTVFQLARRRE